MNLNRRDRRRLAKQGIEPIDPETTELELKLHVVSFHKACEGFIIPMKYLYFSILQPGGDVVWIEEVRRVKRPGKRVESVKSADDNG